MVTKRRFGAGGVPGRQLLRGGRHRAIAVQRVLRRPVHCQRVQPHPRRRVRRLRGPASPRGIHGRGPHGQHLSVGVRCGLPRRGRPVRERAGRRGVPGELDRASRLAGRVGVRVRRGVPWADGRAVRAVPGRAVLSRRHGPDRVCAGLLLPARVRQPDPLPRRPRVPRSDTGDGVRVGQLLSQRVVGGGGVWGGLVLRLAVDSGAAHRFETLMMRRMSVSIMRVHVSAVHDVALS